jgi:hypothetical protein
MLYRNLCSRGALTSPSFSCNPVPAMQGGSTFSVTLSTVFPHISSNIPLRGIAQVMAFHSSATIHTPSLPVSLLLASVKFPFRPETCDLLLWSSPAAADIPILSTGTEPLIVWPVSVLRCSDSQILFVSSSNPLIDFD